MTLGRRIKQKREAMGLTQNEIAAKIGVHVGVVYRYESDVCSPRLEYLEALAHALDTTPNELLGWPDGKAELTAR